MQLEITIENSDLEMYAREMGLELTLEQLEELKGYLKGKEGSFFLAAWDWVDGKVGEFVEVKAQQKR